MQICLESVLKYEQPTKYIVNSPKYSDTFSIPVLTAGKSFVLGYTDEKDGLCRASQNPVIIFDDFTADCKYVDFDFKVKSSAMKILHKVNQNDNLKYYFYAMQAMDYTPFSHKRVWISEYSKLKIKDHSVAEQNKITADLDNVINAINNANKRLNALDELVQSQFVEMFGTLENPARDFQKDILKNLCIKITDGKHGGCKSESDTGRFFVGAREIYDDKVHYDTAPEINVEEFKKDYKRCNIEKGDFLIVNTGATIGKSAIATDERTEHTLLQKSVALLKVRQEKLNPVFIKYCYRVNTSMYLVESSSAQPNLLLSKIKSTEIYVPDIELQNHFASFVHQVDKSKIIVQKQIEDLKELFDSKMTVYFG